MVPADSHKASPTSRYSGSHWANGAYVYRAITLFRRASHPVPLRCIVTVSWSYNPSCAVTQLVWALSLSLATTQEIIVIFFSSAYLDVSVRRVCSILWLVFNQPGFPIRKSADQVIFADPRGLSQLITSFIASESQGIPRILFLTFFYSCAFCAARYAFLICQSSEK